MITRTPTPLLGPLLLLLAASFTASFTASAQDRVPLIDPSRPTAHWTFDNGREFPGATGGLTADGDVKHPSQTHPSLRLLGDFAKGGGYVQAGRKIDAAADVSELSMWVRSPDADHFTLRLIDAGGQCHQLDLKCEASPEWQQVVLPLERFFAKRGTSDAVTNITKYESWGGAKDGNWHGPATAIYLLLGRPEKAKTATLWLGEVTITTKPAEVPGVAVKSTVRLDEVLEGRHEWGSSLGQEFKGAKGSLTLLNGEPAKGQTSLKLAGDFTGGGAYVAMIRRLSDLGVKDVEAIRFRAKTDNAETVTVSMVDATGQTHQRKGVKLVADGRWHDVVIKPSEIAGGEHWGGANNGKWAGPPRELVISVTAGSDPRQKKPTLLLTDIRADVEQAAYAQPAAFSETFDGPAVPAGWEVEGNVTVEPGVGRPGGSLALTRPLDRIDQPVSFTGPAFAVLPGKWKVAASVAAELSSPDNSYNGVVELECLDASGKAVERLAVAEVFRKQDWKPAGGIVEIAKGTSTARFRGTINKADGVFRVDDLSAAFLSTGSQADDRIARVLFSTPALGNLLYPDDPRRVDVAVECRKPLREGQKSMTCVVRDYWGSEQASAVTVPVGRPEASGEGFTYKATIDLAAVPLEVGRYYEVHASLPREGQEPFTNYTSLAILPEAVTKKYKPQDVPFTARNWDNRFEEYIRLTDRLGVRTCGLWGGWDEKPPYKPEAPGLELVKSLGMAWLTNTPAATIERGKTEYDEAALRGGVRNLIEKYGSVRPMIINLGNEPHGKGDVVLRNVAAYKALYEEIKKVDPTIPVVATSVEPNEEYFKAGYGQYCDAFDFHIYESHHDVRRTIAEYRALMKQYGCEKPIWSTELGLNSQGQTRHAVAVQVLKKFTTFFAAGGANVSWFGLLYPDKDGKSAGSSGDSHNVFDSRFNRYAPRLDAVAYYNAVNAIAVKKFVGERTYDNGVYAALFRDAEGQALQVLWTETGRADIGIPLTGVNDVQVVRIDGSRRRLDAGGRTVTLSVTTDPVLLLYSGGPQVLPEQLGPPVALLASPAGKVARRGQSEFDVTLPEKPDEKLSFVLPPRWKTDASLRANVGKPGQGTSMHIVVTPPPGTTARELDLTVRISDNGRVRGELYHRVPISE